MAKLIEQNAKEMLEEYEGDEGTEIPKDAPKDIKKKKLENSKIATFVSEKKRKFKNTKYRTKYDSILNYMEQNLINTETYQAAMKSPSTNVAYSYVYENGSYTQIPVLARNNANDNTARIPLAREPIAYSKIMIGVSVLGAKPPDAVFKSGDKIYARTQYELWKDTWQDSLGNGLNTIKNFYQDLLGSGFAAYRVFPRKIVTTHKGQQRVLFDGIYRQSIDPKRIWVGNSTNVYDRWSWGEVVYEIDQEKVDFCEKYPEAKYYDLEYSGSSQETQVDESVQQDFVTIRYYENQLKNKYCAVCGNFVLYEGEMPNDEGYGHVLWTNCFTRNPSDPYGVGLVEIMRANTEMYDYINGLTAEQIEAEISPLLFGTNTGVGEMTYRRGPNVINPKTQGTSIDVVKTNGNPQQSQFFADKQKVIISENTGINDIIAGQAGEGTLGATVILKEAALNRLIIPRNNVVSCLELDAYITVSWIRQIYSSEQIMKFNTGEEVAQFVQNNPQYFVRKISDEEYESEFVPGEDSEYVEKVKKDGPSEYSVSKKVALGFELDMDEENPENDTISETKDKYQIPANELFSLLEERGHTSRDLIIMIDGSSTLLPSEEINKQRMVEIFTIVNPLIGQIIQSKDSMPELSRALLKSLERILEVQKESLFDWFPKDLYDIIQEGQGVQQPGIEELTQVNQQPGGMDTQMPTPQGLKDPIGDMTQSFKSGFNKEIVNPMKGVLNASIGRAAKSGTN
jgi:hypothetical protein